MGPSLLGAWQVKVAIVDDQASARTLIAGIIRGIHPEIEVFEFFEPEEALVWCEANSPSIVLIDYRMPFLDGVTFTQRLKSTQSGAKTAVIMVSSQDDSSIRHAAFSAGIVSYFKKPITGELKLQVSNLLDALVAQRALPDPMLAAAGPVPADQSLAALRELMTIVRGSTPWMQHPVIGIEALSTAMARHLRLSDAEVAKVARAASVYDIGLLCVPADVLARTEPLDGNQIERIQTGPDLAFRVLREIDEELAVNVRHSHERFNGTGYPDGLTGDLIPLVSRIVAVAGSYCAMTSDRPHRAAFRLSEALSVIQQQAGSHYDPSIVGALLDVHASLHQNTVILPPRDNSLSPSASAAGGVR